MTLVQVRNIPAIYDAVSPSTAFEPSRATDPIHHSYAATSIKKRSAGGGRRINPVANDSPHNAVPKTSSQGAEKSADSRPPPRDN